jgi:hypothetical protein
MVTVLVQLAAVVALAAAHLLAGRLKDASSFWLSFGAGVSVAFVFLHLLPELDEAADDVEESIGHLVVVSDHPVFALAGVLAFYGLERLGRVSRGRGDGAGSSASRSS